MITNFICKFEATKNLVYKAKANHGETLEFSSFILDEDKQVDLTGYTAKVLYQPANTESSTYYEIPAKNDLSCISFEWSQQNDIGEKAYKLFLRLEKDKEVSYPGLYKLELEESPGFQPSVDPGPIVMEFVKVGEYNTYKEETAKKLEALDATDKANLKSSKEYTDAEVKKALGSVYKVKGSATTYTLNGLPADQKTKGDVYNVANDGTLTLGNVLVKAGDNVVWDGAIWDKLASTIDLSDYATKADLEPYAKKTDLEPYATKTDLNAYVKTDTANATFATKTDLNAYMKTIDANNKFATKTDLNAYMKTIDANNKFATKTDLGDINTILDNINGKVI